MPRVGPGPLSPNRGFCVSLWRGTAFSWPVRSARRGLQRSVFRGGAAPVPPSESSANFYLRTLAGEQHRLQPTEKFLPGEVVGDEVDGVGAVDSEAELHGARDLLLAEDRPLRHLAARPV
jgi:hypothetical protein